ncbi:MAG: O-antigen ligase family protein [Patescibacteria group bacterium]|nr:O-antigen ligase family protein [Patescibacteria group bacterium]
MHNLLVAHEYLDADVEVSGQLKKYVGGADSVSKKSAQIPRGRAPGSDLFSLKTERSKSLFWGILATASMSIAVLANLIYGQHLVIYIFALALTFISVLVRPAVGLYTMVICTMWFERQFTLAPLAIQGHIIKFYPLDFLIFFLLISVISRMFFGGWKWYFKKMDWFILIFGAVCTIGFALAYSRGLDFALAFGTYKNYFLYAVVYFLFVAILRAEDDWKHLMHWFTAGGIGLFFFLVYGLLNGRGLWSEYTPLSTAGERLIAGTHAFYLLIFLFWLMAVLLWQRKSEGHISAKNILLVLFAALSGVGLVVSLVRHLWIAAIFVAFFWLIFLPGIRQRLKYLAVVLLVGSLAVVLLLGYLSIGSSISQRFGGARPGQTFVDTATVLGQRTDVGYVTSRQDSSFRWRLATWEAGYTAFIVHPFFGTGLGYVITGTDNGWPFKVAMREIHNDYLAILFQLGVFGALAIVVWFLYLLSGFFSGRKHLRGENLFISRLSFTWWSAALILMAGFSISIYWDINLFVIWWWLALAALRFVWNFYENT